MVFLLFSLGSRRIRSSFGQLKDLMVESHLCFGLSGKYAAISQLPEMVRLLSNEI